MSELIKTGENFDVSKNEQIKKVLNMTLVDGFMFLDFGDNKLVTNGDIEMDATSYVRLEQVIWINGEPYAVLSTNYEQVIINLVTKEEIIRDNYIFYVVHIEGVDNLLKVVMRTNAKDKLLDLEKKAYVKFLEELESYEIDKILDNGLIVLEKDMPNGKIKTIVDVNGKILIKDLKGSVYSLMPFIFITQNDSLTIINLSEENPKVVKITKGIEVVETPVFLSQPKVVILLNKDLIKICDYALNVIREIPVEGMENFADSEVVGHVIKMSFKKDGSFFHTFIDINTGRKITHDYIEGFEYWNPKVFIGRDYPKNFRHEQYGYSDNKINSSFSIYDDNLNLKTSFSALFCDSDFDPNDNFYRVIVEDNGELKYMVYVYSLNKMIEINSDQVYSIPSSEFSYTIENDDVITFVNRNFEVVLPPFSLKDYGVSWHPKRFRYFIKNGYLCMYIYLIDGYGRDVVRTILRDSSGKTLVDDLNIDCRLIGDLIKIRNEEITMFLDTITNQLGELKVLISNSEIEGEKVKFLLDNNSVKRERLLPIH